MNLVELEECKAGFILKGIINHRSRGHFIIFLEHYYFPDFIGAMISTKNTGNQNILMSEGHFEETFEDGTVCKVKFKDSYLVPAKLHKFFDMGPFELCGVLTNDGIRFITKNLENFKVESWANYLEKEKF
ncbi:hypothetical protein [Flavobacterium ardleyense]|uniref:hypothetical protein n=1 Tax=Flavobacterium ardleyense TaxID=2038737 RepID=UPI00298D1C84|nr:hypothetical protein [Flavobacterium ardleyense]